MEFTIEEFNVNLGKRIALYRELAGLTQTELAEKVGYKDRTSIAKIESGTVKIPMKKLAKIAEVLNTSIQVLCLKEESEASEEVIKMTDYNEIFKKSVILLTKLDDEQLQKAYTVLNTMFGG